MSEQWQIGLLAVLFGFISMLLGGLGIVAWYKFQQIDSIKDDLAQTAVKTENRLATMESEIKNARHDHEELYKKAERWFVITGTAALHSPDDHLKADPELERFVMLYKKHNHDLPLDQYSDWEYFRNVFIRIRDDLRATPNERALADGYVELCEHKMTRDGMTP